MKAFDVFQIVHFCTIRNVLSTSVQNVFTPRSMGKCSALKNIQNLSVEQ